jgi:hypothetical protein
MLRFQSESDQSELASVTLRTDTVIMVIRGIPGIIHLAITATMVVIRLTEPTTTPGDRTIIRGIGSTTATTGLIITTATNRAGWCEA